VVLFYGCLICDVWFGFLHLLWACVLVFVLFICNDLCLCYSPLVFPVLVFVFAFFRFFLCFFLVFIVWVVYLRSFGVVCVIVVRVFLRGLFGSGGTCWGSCGGRPPCGFSGYVRVWFVVLKRERGDFDFLGFWCSGSLVVLVDFGICGGFYVILTVRLCGRVVM